MNEREKLISLLSGRSLDVPEDVEYVADCLISEGVRIPVRCRDCKYYYVDYEAEEAGCELYGGLTEPGQFDYCSLGERNDNGKAGS